jgi:hypothetical protein
MPAAPVLVSDDLDVSVRDRKVSLSPAQAFNLAEKLIRKATRQIVTDEADRAVVLGAVRGAD